MLKRHIQKELTSYLKIMPVVLITGARQTGKTTLVETYCKGNGYSFYTFDDELVLSNASKDPAGWLESLPKPVVIDEVQRAPEIFLSIKRDVDKNRIPGRYLLTGSANPLLLPRLGDSLTGRMGIITLFPFSQGELQQKEETFIARIFAETIHRQKYIPLSLDILHEKMLRGGFPTVQTLESMEDVNRWVRSYLQTMMERDVRDISNIEGLREFPRLFRMLATRTGSLLNIADLSRSLGMVNMTLHRYLRLLEILYFIYLLPAWFINLGKRLMKSPKIHLCDTAILAQLIGIDKKGLTANPTLSGQILESFVFSELLKQKSWSTTAFDLYHFRDGIHEVDFILEKPDGSIIGVEVKSAKTIHSEDIKGLKYLQSLAKNRFKRGIILHLGEETTQITKDFWAMPIQSLWE